MTIGFGIIGCGMISRFHARAIEELDGAQVVGCFSEGPGSGEAFAAEHGGTVHASLDSLLADPAVHIVTVCTPSGAHRDAAIAAANAGKHVLVEKPLEITLERCDAMIAACERNNVLLGAILPSRFSAVNVALKAAIDTGRFGTLTLGDSFVKWWRSQEYYDQGGWRGTWALDGGGAYMNQAIHNVDLLQWFMGDVAEIAAVTGTLAHERIEVEDTGVAALKFRNGALGTLTATTSAWPGLLKKTEIHGNRGSAIVEQDDLLMWEFAEPQESDAQLKSQLARKAGTTGGASDPKAISYQGHLAQFRDFVAAVKSGRQPEIDGREGRKSVEIILGIYESARTGRRVTLPLRTST